MRRLNHTQLNYLNIGLMLLSCALAYVAPLELFLFSYAILGPLHYLTEISWLQKRGYFVGGRLDGLFIVGLCALILLFSTFNLGLSSTVFIGIGFGSAVALTFVRKLRLKILLVALVVLVTLLCRKLPAYQALFGILIPTVIHVYVFTGLFILHGALKSRTRSGYLSLAVFVACGAVFFLFNPTLAGLSANTYVRESYAPFQRVVQFIAAFFGLASIKRPDIYTSEPILALLRFIAFAYTYHYLNWFSKTSIIKWHDISYGRLATILALWIGAVALYAFDFKTGLVVLFSLSLGHVVLEFPLNHQTARAIAQQLRLRLRPGAAVRQQNLSPSSSA